jgi:hypothetical protein
LYNLKQTKPIPDFPAYSITKAGQVWSNYYGGRWLKFNLCSDGRHHEVLCKKGQTYPKLVHRLVLETYIGPCPDGMECRHLDGNPLNNNLSNLRWGTKSENVRDAINHGTFNAIPPRFEGETHPNSKLTEQDVRMIVYIRKTNLFTQREIAKMFNISEYAISDIIRRKSWKHIWKSPKEQELEKKVNGGTTA